MNSFLKKIVAATGLTRRGQLAEATAAIQRALTGASTDYRADSPQSEREDSARTSEDVLDGLVREVEPAPRIASHASLADPLRPRPAGAAGPAAGSADDPADAAADPADPATRAAAVAAVAAALAAATAAATSAWASASVETKPRPDPTRQHGGRFSESSFTAEAGTRAFKLFEPSGFEGRALPLVVMLHGCTQDPDDFAAGTRMNLLAQERGLLVLYPQQAPRSNAQKCWNWFVPGDQQRGQGEPALLAGMTRHVMETHPVDADRVWVAGLSAGGAMAAILAREYPDLFAAAGVHSGLPPGAAHDIVSAFSAMKSATRGAFPSWPGVSGGMPARAPLVAWPGTALAPMAGPEPELADEAAGGSRGAPLIVFHGDADGTVNVANGSHVVEAALGPDAARPGAASVSAGTAGAGRRFTRTVFHPDPAAGPSRAEHWVVHGAGHAWSGGDTAGSFTDHQGPDASREMLRFFAEHPRQRPAPRLAPTAS
ncbi:MAG: PHB depolymerase family esterase [Caldimonas sp.]